MAEDTTPLTQEERAELEQLRAEKAAREAAEKARRERAELNKLRAEQSLAKDAEPTPSAKDTRELAGRRAEDERIREARERGRRLMEPDDDLAMPLGQKVVLIAMALIVLAIIATILFGPK